MLPDPTLPEHFPARARSRRSIHGLTPSQEAGCASVSSLQMRKTES